MKFLLSMRKARWPKTPLRRSTQVTENVSQHLLGFEWAKSDVLVGGVK